MNVFGNPFFPPLRPLPRSRAREGYQHNKRVALRNQFVPTGKGSPKARVREATPTLFATNSPRRAHLRLAGTGAEGFRQTKGTKE